jgi:hypothetical protein
VPEASYLIGIHWDAPSEVFLGSLNITIEVLNGDVLAYTGRTVLEGTLDPADAPVLPLDGTYQDAPDWRGQVFRAPLASGETRWYRLEMERGETMNAVARFPANRFEGADTEGEFTIVLTDLEGRPVGGTLDERPHLSQSFGQTRHQAVVGGTTSSDPDPVPETVLIGYRWDGPPGQESEILFEVEAIFDPNRKEAADQIEAETALEETQETGPIAQPEAVAATTTMLNAADEGAGGGGFPRAILVAVGFLALAGVALPFLIRRSRAR